MIKTLDALFIDKIFQPYISRGIMGLKNQYDITAFFLAGGIVFSLICLITSSFGFMTIFLIFAMLMAVGAIEICSKLKPVVVNDVQTAMLRKDTSRLRFSTFLAVVSTHLFIIYPPLPMMCLQTAMVLYWIALNIMGCRLPKDGQSNPPPSSPPPPNPWV